MDFSKLILDTSKLSKDFFAYETDSTNINTLEHNDVINDWHIERIRRLNSTAEYLWLSLQRLNYFGERLSQLEGEVSQGEECAVLFKYHRAACREICINVDIYVESIKSFCRYYFFMDKMKTDDTRVWYKTFEQYKGISGWPYINNFLSACLTMFKNSDTQFLIQIRNKEVHNESPLELMNYKFQENELLPVPTEYVISSEKLHNRIVNVMELLILVSSSLQEILNNISPAEIYRYLSNKDGRLENIIKMEDRYKREREYFQQFQQ